MKIMEVKGVFERPIAELYNSNIQLIEGLPSISNFVQRNDLKNAFNCFFHISLVQKSRFETLLGKNLQDFKSDVIQRILEDTFSTATQLEDPELQEACYIIFLQSIIYFEISSYQKLAREMQELPDANLEVLINQNLGELIKFDEAMAVLSENLTISKPFCF